MPNSQRLGRSHAIGVALAAAFAAAGLLSAPGEAQAAACPNSGSIYTLTDRNSIACVNTGPNNQQGMFDWYVDGVDQLSKQWFWYRIGSNGPEQSIDTIGAPAVSVSDTNGDNVNDRLNILYTAPSFTIAVQYTLAGQDFDSGKSHIDESIVITRTSGPALDLYFFQYSDFDLGFGPGHENDDTVQFVVDNRMLQYDPSTVYPYPNGATPVNFAETIDSPPPTYCEVNTVGTPGNTLDKLNDGAAQNLSSNCATPLTGNVSWAFEWHTSLTGPIGSPLSKLTILKDKDIAITLPRDGFDSQSAPEPATLALFGFGAAGLALIRRRLSASR